MNIGLRLKVGIFILISLATFVGSSLWLSQVKLFSRSYRFQIAFEDVYGLTTQSRVQLLGVGVGRVTQIRLRPEVILVDVEINDPSIRIPIDSAVTVGSFSTGGKYVDIIPVSTSLYPAQVVGPGMTVLGTSPTHLDTQFEKVQYQLSRMRSFLDDPQQQAFIDQQIESIISLAQRFSSMGDRTLALTSHRVPQIDALDRQAAQRLPAMTAQLYQLRDQAQQMTRTAQQLRLMGHALGANGQAMLLQLRGLSGQAHGMLDNLEHMGQLRTLGPKVKSALDNMRKLLNEFDSLLQFVAPASPSPVPGSSTAPIAPATPAVALPKVTQ